MSSENLEIASLLGALKEPVVIDFDAVQKLFQKVIEYLLSYMLIKIISFYIDWFFCYSETKVLMLTFFCYYYFRKLVFGIQFVVVMVVGGGVIFWMLLEGVFN